MTTMSKVVWLGVTRIAELAPQLVDGGEGWLSDSERARLARMQRASRRSEFLASRLSMRHLLAAAYGGAPQDWLLEAPDGAAPRVLRSPVRVLPTLALSHSGDWVACAAAECALGVDIEGLRPGRNHSRLYDAVCSSAERQRLAALPPDQQTAEFLTQWVLKEAWLKARGEGIASGPLGGIETHALGVLPNSRVWRAPAGWLAVCVEGDVELRWAWPRPEGHFDGDGTAWSVARVRA